MWVAVRWPDALACLLSVNTCSKCLLIVSVALGLGVFTHLADKRRRAAYPLDGCCAAGGSLYEEAVPTGFL